MGDFEKFPAGLNQDYGSNRLPPPQVGTGGGGAITIKDEGTTLTTGATSIDFVGAGVTAGAGGTAVTVTIPGGGGGGTPSLPAKSVQFNNSGAFGGDANLLWDSGTATVQLTGSLAFLGAGNRITGDFSNATHASRALFVTSTVNSFSSVGIAPSGTGVSAFLSAYANSNPAAAQQIAQFGETGTVAFVNATPINAGTQGSLELRIGGTARLTLDANGFVFSRLGTSKPLTYAASITVDLSTYPWSPVVLDVTLTGALTINFTNGYDGQRVEVRYRQDGSGSRLLTHGANVRFGTTIPSVALTTTANKVDKIAYEWIAADGKADVMAFVGGY